jgi:hypothetical protein
MNYLRVFDFPKNHRRARASRPEERLVLHAPNDAAYQPPELP